MVLVAFAHDPQLGGPRCDEEFSVVLIVLSSTSEIPSSVRSWAFESRFRVRLLALQEKAETHLASHLGRNFENLWCCQVLRRLELGWRQTERFGVALRRPTTSATADVTVAATEATTTSRTCTSFLQSQPWFKAVRDRACDRCKFKCRSRSRHEELGRGGRGIASRNVEQIFAFCDQTTPARPCSRFHAEALEEKRTSVLARSGRRLIECGTGDIIVSA